MKVYRQKNYEVAKARVNYVTVQWLYDSTDDLQDGIRATTAKGSDSFVHLTRPVAGQAHSAGTTSRSWETEVEPMGGIKTGQVFSDEPNAVWEEFGTGIYNEQGGGRKTPWKYGIDRGQGEEWFTTIGKRARRPARKAWLLRVDGIILELKKRMSKL